MKNDGYCRYFASVDCRSYTDEQCCDCCYNPHSETKAVMRAYGCNKPENDPMKQRLLTALDLYEAGRTGAAYDVLCAVCKTLKGAYDERS